MPRWFHPGLALAVGVLAAGVAVAGLHPLVAGVAGVLVVLLMTSVARRRVAQAALGRPAGWGDVVRPAAGIDPSQPGPALVQNLPVPLLILSRAGRVLVANPAAQRILNFVAPDTHFAHLIRAPAFVEAVSATLEDGTARNIEFAAFQGAERFYEARVGLLPPDAGFGPERMAIVQLEDRTEAHRSEQLRTDFIANASHELRTPLASIIGYIETLQNHARDDAEAREKFLTIMGREAGRMQRLVNDLMSLSRIELSEHLRPVEAVRLDLIARESAAALLPLARQRGIDVRIDLAGARLEVLGDRDQLAQVFSNLLDNAIKYCGPDATVRVAAAEPSKANPARHGISVSDTGPGISREHLPRLTERFYRVNVASSRNKGGTGLGLAIAKHILNRHKGRLEIVSSPGAGSTFTVWIPALAGTGSLAPPAAIAEAPVAVP